MFRCLAGLKNSNLPSSGTTTLRKPQTSQLLFSNLTPLNAFKMLGVEYITPDVATKMLPLQNEVCSLIVQTVLVFPFSVAKITQ
jgi:hypothetical protein